LGGGIRGLCLKTIKTDISGKLDLYDLLGCPDCKKALPDGEFDRYSLEKHSDYFKCTQNVDLNIPLLKVLLFYCQKKNLDSFILIL